MVKNIFIDIFINTYKFLCDCYQMLMVNIFKQILKYNAVRNHDISFCMHGLILVWKEAFKGPYMVILW